MPIRRISNPDIASQTEGPGLLRRLLAGGVRAGSGVLGAEGGGTGAAITGAGEGIAEMIEGSPLSGPRIATEAALGAVPFGKVIKAGKPLVSTLRSGLFSGAGEGMREVARGEQIDPRAIGRSALLGGIFGNVFGRIGGSKVETPPAGPSYEVEHTAVPGGRVLDEKGKLTPVGMGRTIKGIPEAPVPPTPVDPRAAYWAKRGMNPPTAPGRMASPQFQLPFEGAPEEAVVQGGKIPYMESGAYPEGSAAKSAAKAAKEAEKAARDRAIQDRIDQAIEEGNLQPGKTAVSEGGSVETPEGRMSYRTSYRVPKKADEEGGFRVISDEPIDTPGVPVAESTPPAAEPDAPSPSPLEKILTSAAPKKVRAPRAPKVQTPQQEAAQRSYDELLARIKAEGAAPPPETAGGLPVAPEGPSTPPPGPKWLSAADIEPTQPLPPMDVDRRRFGTLDPYAGFSIAPGSKPLEVLPEGSPEFLAAEKALASPAAVPSNLERLSPDEFKGFPMEPVSGGAGVQVEGATQGLSPLARLFKSRVDAAGQGYRDIKAVLGAEPGLKEPTLTGNSPYQIAGKGLREEAQAAGLPTGKAAAPEPSIAEPPAPSGIGPGQTAKARQAALAKRQAAKAEQQQWLPDYEKELAEAQRMKEAGASPEQIQQTLLQRLKGEAGSMDPAFAARLGMAATGAGLGGVFGGASGHPITGMLIGGAIGGSLSPEMIASGLRQLGAHPETAEAAKDAVSNPSGVKDIAQRLYAGLPQFQRFNLLMDAWGLPANAIAGPYGSAAMAGLEAHLSGDPRGMEVLRRLNPEEFMRRWNSAREEAHRLVAEGELGRAETQITGHGKVQEMMQWPGVQMTAGDVAARQILVEAGFTEEEARRITMTGEPETAAAKKLANLSKGSTLLQLLQPFARTPANIAEQGIYRTPGFGIAAQLLGRETPDSVRQMAIQQGLGLGAGAVGYAAGANLDPETARTVRRYMTNVGGQYSLPVGLGFAMGQASQSGNGPLSAQSAANLYNALPLPTTAPIASWVKSATAGGPPRGLVPNSLVEWATPTNTSATNPLTRPGRFRR